MTNEPTSHRDVESKNRALWDEIAPVHLKAYQEVALLRRRARGQILILRVSGEGDSARIASHARTSARTLECLQTHHCAGS